MNSVPRVVHVIQHLAMGGMENGIVNLINYTPADRIAHAVVCLSHYTDFRARITNPDVPVVALHKQPGVDPAIYPRLWRTFRELRPDIVHSRNLPAVDCAPISRAAGVIAHVHGEHGWDVHDLHGTQAKYLRYRRWMRPFVSRYVAVSRDIERWLVERVGVRAACITQIYNGVDVDRFAPRTADYQRPEGAPFGLVDDTVVIGSVGRLQAVKDPLQLARAFGAAAAASAEFRRLARFVWVGDGPLRDALEAELTNCGVRELAWLPGARRDVPELLRMLDLFVCPSLNEGISNGILEAMASGLSVVATDVGGNGELVAVGVSGELVPAGDTNAMAQALLRYFSDERRRRRHGGAGRERAVQQFSLGAMVQNYLALYDSLLPRQRRAA